MFQRHEQNTSDFPSHFELPGGDVGVQLEQTLTNPRFELKDSGESRPIFLVLRDFGVRLCS